MMQMTIQDQEYLINRTNKFFEKYGISKKWLAAKVGIPVQKLSYLGNVSRRLKKERDVIK